MGPMVHIQCPELRNGGINALLDTGSDYNLICVEALKDNILCNNDKVGSVEGITSSSMPISGTIILKILGINVFFHIVPAPPGGYKAILGNDFFIKERVKISFFWNTLVSKHNLIKPIPIINPRRSKKPKILALGTGPKIYLPCNSLIGNYQRFLVDTGGDACLINASALRLEVPIDTERATTFRGIDDNSFKTLGIVTLKILGMDVEFHVCGEDLPLPGVGILGNNLLEQEKAEISYHTQNISFLSKPNKTIHFSLEQEQSSRYTIPLRMRVAVAIPIKNPKKKEGYLPRVNLPKGVLCGEAAVRVEDGYAMCMVINLNSEPAEIAIKRPGRPKGVKNKPRIKSAPEIRDTIASRLRQRKIGSTRVPPNANYKESSITEESQPEETQEIAQTSEQGDDDVFEKELPATIDSTPREIDASLEADGEEEPEKQLATPRARRKTQELIKMFDQLLERRPITWREKDMIDDPKNQRTPSELKVQKIVNSRLAKEIRESMDEIPIFDLDASANPNLPMFSDRESEEDNNELNEFLRENDVETDTSTNEVSIDDTNEPDESYLTPARPSTSNRFRGYMNDGPLPKTPLWARTLIPDELNRMGIRYDHATQDVTLDELVRRESTDPAQQRQAVEPSADNTRPTEPDIENPDKFPTTESELPDQDKNLEFGKTPPESSENSSDTPDGSRKTDPSPLKSNYPQISVSDPPTSDQAEEILSERRGRPKISSSSSSDEEGPPKGRVNNIKFMNSRDGLTYARDHMVHFLAADCEVIKPVAKLLRDVKFINAEDHLAAKPKKGDVFVTKLGRCKIFTVFIKTYHFEKIEPIHLVEGLRSLRQSMHKYQIHCLRCSKQGDEFVDLDIKKYLEQEL
ncbi:Protein of unknown function, partial [Cotesia congregata]